RRRHRARQTHRASRWAEVALWRPAARERPAHPPPDRRRSKTVRLQLHRWRALTTAETELRPVDWAAAALVRMAFPRPEAARAAHPRMAPAVRRVLRSWGCPTTPRPGCPRKARPSAARRGPKLAVHPSRPTPVRQEGREPAEPHPIPEPPEDS